MFTKQYYEKQIVSDKSLKHENKEYVKDHKDIKDKDKDKEHKEYIKEKDIHKEEVFEYPQTQIPGVGPGPEAVRQVADLNKNVEVTKVTEATKLVETKQVAFEKPIHKEIKIEKLEIKEFKFEHKEFKEKEIYEGKQLVDNTGYPGLGGDPVEQRLASLEAAVSQLVHFIPAELRPDLSQGALKQEPTTTKPGATEAPAAKETKK